MTSGSVLGDDFIEILRTVEGIGTLPVDVLAEMATDMSIVQLADGEPLIRQNDRGAALCVVVSGTLAVAWHDRTGTERALPDLPAASLVGEVSVLSDTPALVTVKARGAATLAQLTRAGFERFSERSPAGALALIDVLRPQLHRHALRFTLHHAKAFRDLDAHFITGLEAELEPVSLYSSETLIRQGDAGDSMYIVISGRLRVVKRSPDGPAVVLAEVGPGETIGEMALITGEPRSAEVYAIRDSHVAKLSKAAAERLLTRHPIPALGLLAHGPVSRVRQMSSGRTQVAPIATIAIVASGPDAPIDAFGARLCEGLSRLGATLRVTSQFVDGQFGRAGAAQAYDRHGAAARLIEWLAEQELEHRFVVYQADAGCTPWTERSIRQADHVVIVASARGDPRPGEIETELLRQDSERGASTLALCYEPGTAPSGTARWLTGRRLARHVHVRMEEPRDFERAARLLTGQAIGLVLGGGFARGIAHIGVLRALREYDIPIDVLGGSSMGAMIGAQHLLGWDDDRIVRDLTEGLSSATRDLTIPFLAFKRGGTHARVLQSFFGESRIEDLWLPFFCTSSNLNQADLKIHTTGLLATALLATTRAPGVFPPVVIDGELHVDGGLINNVPVDVMKTFSNQGTVIGVDVSPPHHIKPIVDYGDNISGWQAIWNRFNPTRRKRSYRPSILLVLMRLIEFGGISYRVRNASYADLYIAPDVLQFKRNDFHKAPQIIQAGYTKAHEDIGAWLGRVGVAREPGAGSLRLAGHLREPPP